MKLYTMDEMKKTASLEQLEIIENFDFDSIQNDSGVVITTLKDGRKVIAMRIEYHDIFGCTAQHASMIRFILA